MSRYEVNKAANSRETVRQPAPFTAIARKTVQEDQRGRSGLSGHVLRVQHRQMAYLGKVAASARRPYRLPPAQSPLSPGSPRASQRNSLPSFSGR